MQCTTAGATSRKRLCAAHHAPTFTNPELLTLEHPMYTSMYQTVGGIKPLGKGKASTDLRVHDGSQLSAPCVTLQQSHRINTSAIKFLAQVSLRFQTRLLSATDIWP